MQFCSEILILVSYILLVNSQIVLTEWEFWFNRGKFFWKSWEDIEVYVAGVLPNIAKFVPITFRCSAIHEFIARADIVSDRFEWRQKKFQSMKSEVILFLSTLYNWACIHCFHIKWYARTTYTYTDMHTHTYRYDASESIIAMGGNRSGSWWLIVLKED